MHSTIKITYVFIASLLIFSGCKDDQEVVEPESNESSIPAFYGDASNNEPTFTLVASSAERIAEPQDLDFHPMRENELWVINKGTNNTGGSTVTLTNAGMDGQEFDWRRDGNAWHFMALPSAISFSKENGNFGTTANILDANRNNGSFTGPSLWSSDLDIYARDPGPGLNGSHLDMLHGSPYCMGMESDKDNAFWVFDSYNEHITWYDFSDDHGPGHDDHSDGVIYRYTELEVTREPGVPAHMVKDDASILYICDPAESRILWMNTLSGSIDRALPLVNELLASHQQMKDLEWGVFTDVDLDKPCGIEVVGNILYVSDFGTGEIIAYNTESNMELGRIDTGDAGIMGIKAGTDGKLWYVNANNSTVHRIDQN